MPVYAYEGVQNNGSRVSGLVDADSPRNARQKLKSQGIVPITLAPREDSLSKPVFSPGKKAGAREMSLFTRQLAILVGAKIPVVDSLGAILDQGLTDPLGGVVAAVREDVKEGQSLNRALSLHPRIFSDLFVNMVRAGEESGTLETMLDRLADFIENQLQTRRKILGSLFYPIILLGVGILMIIFLLAVVMPRITAIFQGLKATLPLPTRLLMGVSDWIRHETIFLAGAIALLSFLAVGAFRSHRTRIDALALKIPRIGSLIAADQISRFARTLSVLLKGGVPLQRALEICSSVLSNRVLRNAVIESREAVRNGESLGNALKRHPEIPRLAIHMIQTGERSGMLEELLRKMAEGYEAEVSQTVSALTSIIEPVMILFIGAIVLFMVLAILLPIFEMSQAVQ
jgi:general secretion pathway protein F